MNDKAVVDRFEEDKAVLLVGDKEDQMVVERTLLPLNTQEGDWLRVEVVDGRVIRTEFDGEETQRVQARIASKLDELRRGEYLKA